MQFVQMHAYATYPNNVITFSFYLCTCICSRDHWSFYTNYLDYQIRRYPTREGTKAGHYPIIEAKDFYQRNKSTEAAKKCERLRLNI